MNRFLKASLFVLLAALVATCCSACIPPFIDGLVDAPDYFEETVKCRVFILNPNADEGYDTTEGDNLELTTLTDENENNTVMQRYYSFTFKSKDDFTLQGVAFIVEAQEAASFSFQLKTDDASFYQSIEINTEAVIVEFLDLNLDISSSSEVVITLTNPLISNVPYRIDSVIFLV